MKVRGLVIQIIFQKPDKITIEFHKEEIFVAILSDIVAAGCRFRLYVLRNLRICGKICIFVGVYLRIKG